MELEVYADTEALAEGAARRIAGLLADGNGRGNIGLAGGTTPRETYLRLRDQPVDWARIDVWLSDERWVPKDHPDSNGRMALDALLTGVPAVFHRPRWAPWMTADDSAAHYEAELRELFPDGSPDVVLLGMGNDGHVASLFPNTEAVEEDRRWFVANFVSMLDAWRLTATFRLIKAARHVLFLVSGAGKAATLAEVWEGNTRLPARLAAEGGGEVVFLVDEPAAAQIPR